jgi:hydroxyethylthiazole kinase-like uncharacterized protein yjeF
MASNSERITSKYCVASTRWHDLHGCAATRLLEIPAFSGPTQPTLMQQAGLAVAQLALALAPHAHVFWIACGPGNNGGDGFQAAYHLQNWGKAVLVSTCAPATSYSSDALRALSDAREVGVCFTEQAPESFDFCIDALFGIGTLRPFSPLLCNWIERMCDGTAPVLSIDLPSGLNGDTGNLNLHHVQADYTLSLLTLKPGLFTQAGRDACGEIWFNPLQPTSHVAADARLIGPPATPARIHASHKGSYGDVAVIGGAPGMTGAALLAGNAALHGGAGRVFVSLLDHQGALALPPELMLRSVDQLPLQGTVVAGCGGGEAIAQHLPTLLHQAHQLVLDADALNQIARKPEWQALVAQRVFGRTILTPHPLEAARLLGCSTEHIQRDRVHAAQVLARRFQCVVVLKGSGSIVCGPDTLPHINPTGNARLATAGTGDVLAGLLGAHLANTQDAWGAACASVYQHGLTAERWNSNSHLTAAALANAL